MGQSKAMEATGLKGFINKYGKGGEMDHRSLGLLVNTIVHSRSF